MLTNFYSTSGMVTTTKTTLSYPTHYHYIMSKILVGTCKMPLGLESPTIGATFFKTKTDEQLAQCSESFQAVLDLFIHFFKHREIQDFDSNISFRMDGYSKSIF